MIERVVAMYFSPTNTTKKVVKEIAGGLAVDLGCEQSDVDFTLPTVRESDTGLWTVRRLGRFWNAGLCRKSSEYPFKIYSYGAGRRSSGCSYGAFW
ncbi:MAG: hypothetical protein V8R85_05415 [Frisingicoccus sp.]